MSNPWGHTPKVFLGGLLSVNRAKEGIETWSLLEEEIHEYKTQSIFNQNIHGTTSLFKLIMQIIITIFQSDQLLYRHYCFSSCWKMAIHLKVYILNILKANEDKVFLTFFPCRVRWWSAAEPRVDKSLLVLAANATGFRRDWVQSSTPPQVTFSK